jgi:hypothetical protein
MNINFGRAGMLADEIISGAIPGSRKLSGTTELSRPKDPRGVRFFPNNSGQDRDIAGISIKFFISRMVGFFYHTTKNRFAVVQETKGKILKLSPSKSMRLSVGYLILPS